MVNIRTGRRSGLVLRGGRNRRDTLWFNVGGTGTTPSSSSTAALLNSLNAAALALTPFTFIRARGYLHIRSDQVAADEDQALNLGFAVVSTQASAIGVTAIPTPTTDQGSDLWFVYESLASSQFTGSADTLRGIGKEYDSRGMRKVEEGQDLAVVIETEVTGLTSGLFVRHWGRVLVKLH